MPDSKTTAAPAAAPDPAGVTLATGDTDATDEKQAATKHGDELTYEQWAYGGAQTFAEVDDFLNATEIENAVQGELYVFDALLSNIRNDPATDAGVKAARIRALAADLEERLAVAEAEARRGERALTGDTTDPGQFRAFKDAHGKWRWIAIHSNRYRDGEREIFSEDSHRRFVDRAMQFKALPALRMFHVPADFGRADLVDYDDRGFVVSSGTFNEGMDDVAQRLASMKGLGCSHGYYYRPEDLRDGVYHDYHSFEVTVLPAERAANPLTAFFAEKEFPMLNPERRKFLVEVAGEERTKDIERAIGTLADKARERGLDYKSVEGLRLMEFWPDEAGAKEGDMPDETNAAAAATATAVADPPAASEPASAEQTAQQPPAADAVETPPEPTEDERAEAEAARAAATAAEGERAASTAAMETIGAAMLPLITEAVKAGNAPLEERIGNIEAELAGVKELSEGLRQSRDAEVADLHRPRIGPTAATPASASGANVVSDDAAQAAKDRGGTPAPATPADAAIQDYVGDLIQHLSISQNGVAAS